MLFYSLDAPAPATVHVLDTLDLGEVRVAVSADVGPDLIAPWRSPTAAIIYIEDSVDTTRLDMVSAPTRGDANVILRFPDDTSVFRYPPLDGTLSGNSIPFTDETQLLWDLHNLGGDDRIEAADRLRQSSWLRDTGGN